MTDASRRTDMLQTEILLSLGWAPTGATVAELVADTRASDGRVRRQLKRLVASGELVERRERRGRARLVYYSVAALEWIEPEPVRADPPPPPSARRVWDVQWLEGRALRRTGLRFPSYQAARDHGRELGVLGRMTTTVYSQVLPLAAAA